MTTEVTLENKFQICLTKCNSFETRGKALNDIKTLISLNKNNQKILRYYITCLKMDPKSQNISNITNEPLHRNMEKIYMILLISLRI